MKQTITALALLSILGTSFATEPLNLKLNHPRPDPTPQPQSQTSEKNHSNRDFWRLVGASGLALGIYTLTFGERKKNKVAVELGDNATASVTVRLEL